MDEPRTILISDPDTVAKLQPPATERGQAADLVARGRFGVDTAGAVDGLLEIYNVELVPVELRRLSLARDAHARFGKGTGHPVQLNFGDCFSYALARDLGVPLLFKGDDFAATDLTLASAG